MTTETSYHDIESLFSGIATGIMGTRFEMLLCGVSEDDANALWEVSTSELQRLELVFNRFSPNSEVSVWNAGNRASVSDVLLDSFCLCERYRILTCGLFDVHRGGCADADFGGFAKGYALRRIAGIIDAVPNAFVNFGSSTILAKGSHPFGEGWKVSLPDPYSGRELAEFTLRDRTLSTSGNTPRYSGHITNPLSGQIVVAKKLAAVICPDPLDAEVLSTACMMAGPGQLEAIGTHFPDAVIKVFN